MTGGTSRHPDPYSFVLFAAPLITSLLLGGGTNVFQSADVLAEGLCLPFLVASAVQLGRRLESRPIALALATACAFVLVPIIQLVPFPPFVWTVLGGRDAIASAYPVAGITPPWLGISLYPAATWRSALALIPPLAVFAGVLQLNFRERRIAAYCVIAFGFASFLLVLLQLVQGPASPLRFYTDNVNSAVALFANPNHLAALFYCCILASTTLFVVHALSLTSDLPRRDRKFSLGQAVVPITFLALCCLFLFGVALTRSRAGLALSLLAGVVGVAASLPYAKRMASSRWTIILGMFGLFVVGAVLNYSIYDVLQRAQGGLADDSRLRIAELSKEILRQYLPFGAGGGTFLPIYAMHETVGSALSLPVNRAHNEFLEWGIEGGLAYYCLLCIAVCWLGWLIARTWVDGVGPYFLDASVTRACAAMPVMLLAHSLVDYPLRTIALSAVGAFSVGMAVAAVVDPAAAVQGDLAPEEPSAKRRSRRRRRSFSVRSR